jgi:hypothetical protein
MRSLPAAHLVLLLCAADRAAAASPTEPFTVVRSSGAYVRVDIGSTRVPGRLLRLATVLTADEAVPAVLDRIERVCTTLCGDDGEETCHYEAIVRATRPVEGPVAVLSGRPRVSDVATLASGPERPIDADADWLAVTQSGQAELGASYGWRRYPDGIYYAFGSAGRDGYAPGIALSSCTQRSVGPLTSLVCGDTATFLYDGRRPVASSFADYGESTIAPQIRFRLDGADAVIIRYGLKAHVVAALLLKTAGTWRILFRAADYDLLC